MWLGLPWGAWAHAAQNMAHPTSQKDQTASKNICHRSDLVRCCHSTSTRDGHHALPYHTCYNYTSLASSPCTHIAWVIPPPRLGHSCLQTYAAVASNSQIMAAVYIFNNVSCPSIYDFESIVYMCIMNHFKIFCQHFLLLLSLASGTCVQDYIIALPLEMTLFRCW